MSWGLPLNPSSVSVVSALSEARVSPSLPSLTLTPRESQRRRSPERGGLSLHRPPPPREPFKRQNVSRGVRGEQAGLRSPQPAPVLWPGLRNPSTWCRDLSFSGVCLATLDFRVSQAETLLFV